MNEATKFDPWSDPWPTDFFQSKDKRNQYTCGACGQSIVTVDVDNGVTPFALRCRATPGCEGTMQSHAYRVDPTVEPDWEWYRPSREECLRREPGMRDHIEKGGLELRRVNFELQQKQALVALLNAALAKHEVSVEQRIRAEERERAVRIVRHADAEGWANAEDLAAALREGK